MEGVVVMPYTNDDLIAARKSLSMLCRCLLCQCRAPIGFGLGIQNASNLRSRERITEVPLIVDAGVGTASDPP